MNIRNVIIGLILFRCIFLFIPATSIHPFPFKNDFVDGIPAVSYWWNQIENACWMTVCLLWYNDRSTRDVLALCVIVAYDWLDFTLNGNTAFMNVVIPGLGEYPVTNNVVMLAAYPLMTYKNRENTTFQEGF